jgi:L-ascorbate metabolism protein UlaG (beta-lactamase superfamily)
VDARLEELKEAKRQPMRIQNCSGGAMMVLGLLAVLPGAVTTATAQIRVGKLPETEDGRHHWSWRVTYIANEGVLLGRNAHSVLIDALFRDGIEGYDHLDAFAQNYIEEGGKPFNEVALLLATHKHADHFNAEAVARFLKENDKAIFASSPQVVELLTPAIGGDSGIAERIKTVDPKGDGKVEFTHGLLKVEVLKLSHGDGQMSDVTNLAFIVHMGDKRVLHVGDAQLNEATMAPLKKYAVGVNAACVPYWWLLDEKGRVFVRDTLKAGRVIGLHVPPAEAETIRSRIREADKTFVVLLRYTQSIRFTG